MTPGLTRRRFLLLGAAVAGTAGCKAKSFTCTDVSSLDTTQAHGRDVVEYRDTTTDPARACSKCRHYIPPPSGDACGTCKLVAGPIHPNGTSKVFTPA